MDYLEVGCRRGPDPVTRRYNLYRTSVVNDTLAVHVATFDATLGEAYNRENCERARALFQAQPGVQTKFWCERVRMPKRAP